MALYEESKTIVCPLLSLYPNRREGTAMSRHIDKEALVAAVMSSTELDNEQKSQLIRLIREQKKYGLVWEDSTEDAWEKMKTSIPVLKEVNDKRILNDKDGEHYPNHAIIEADNLHALIALTYTHAGMIDVIYIDPPYNTGNKDFVYNDSFIGEDDAYRHSKWLSFMEKRLQIAKTLLSERGVIFISIDDNEQANLKLLCDEVFGERNFIAKFDWRKKTGANDAKDIAIVTESILLYARNHDFTVESKIWKRDEESINQGRYKFEDEFVETRGKYYYDTLDRGGLQYSDSMNFGIRPPDGGIIYPNGRNTFVNDGWIWKWGQEKVKWGIENKFLEFVKSKKSVGSAYTIKYKVYQYVDNEGNVREKSGRAYMNLINEPINQIGNSEMKEIFNNKTPFSNPKPIGLIKYLLKTLKCEDSTILDFFAGSGTTLHATMQLNAEDGGHRQCILVTNNENNICEEVTYERNKRVIEGYTTPKGEQVAGLSHNNLRYYKLDFNPRKQSHQDNRELFYGLKDLLCIKENIYQEQQQFGSLSLVGKEQMLRYFAENGREMLMVYDTRVIPFIVSEIAQRDEQELPLKIYIFADGAYPYTDDFSSVIEKVSLVPMPYAYYRGIKDSLPDAEPTKVDDTELTNEEQQAMIAEAIALESKE